MTKLPSRSELETHCRRSAEGDCPWSVYTDDPTVIRKLTRLHGPGTPMGEHGRTWELPKRAISFRSGKPKQGVSTAQLQGLAKARRKKASGVD